MQVDLFEQFRRGRRGWWSTTAIVSSKPIYDFSRFYQFPHHMVRASFEQFDVHRGHSLSPRPCLGPFVLVAGPQSRSPISTPDGHRLEPPTTRRESTLIPPRTEWFSFPSRFPHRLPRELHVPMPRLCFPTTARGCDCCSFCAALSSIPASVQHPPPLLPRFLRVPARSVVVFHFSPPLPPISSACSAVSCLAGFSPWPPPLGLLCSLPCPPPWQVLSPWLPTPGGMQLQWSGPLHGLVI